MVKIATRLILELLRTLVLVVWGIVGAIFWIPFLARMTTIFTVMILLSVSKGGSILNAEKGLDAAVRFYINGFEKINEGINNIVKGKAGQNKQEILEQGSIQSLIIQVLYTMVFWASTLLIFGAISIPDGLENFNNNQSGVVEKSKQEPLSPEEKIE